MAANLTIKVEKTDDFDEFEVEEEIDSIPLANRLKMLSGTEIESPVCSEGERQRPRMFPQMPPIDLTIKEEETDGSLQGTLEGRCAYSMDYTNHHNAGKGTENSHLTDKGISNVNSDSHGTAKENSSSTFTTSSNKVMGLSCMNSEYPQKVCDSQESLSHIPSSFLTIQEDDKKCLLQSNDTEYETPVEQGPVPYVNNIILALPVNMKVEILKSGSESHYKNTVGTSVKNNNMVAVKSETGTWGDSYEDAIDHMPLGERKQLLLARSAFNLDSSRNLKCLRKSLPSAFECTANLSESGKPEGIIRRRKRKKSATDSAETALEEDAPGLLKALVEKGVLLDEIKLYDGVLEGEDALDISSEEDSFEDLEAVVSKLFSERSNFFKFAPQRNTNVSRPSYCLDCLLSLVEQTRYLQFRKWPVEWGWCRDLQSFIFVFERHNRIVLERPEYGYATYFFELVDSLPIEWQIKRLVTAMKLTSCSRTTLIENKSLTVGEDLTEGEARVLEGYGWTPNTGLGSMLNYCDRVVHDKQNDKNVSEWRSKIGKLLMNGYDGGTIILPHLPKKFKGVAHSRVDISHSGIEAEI